MSQNLDALGSVKFRMIRLQKIAIELGNSELDVLELGYSLVCAEIWRNSYLEIRELVVGCSQNLDTFMLLSIPVKF